VGFRSSRGLGHHQPPASLSEPLVLPLVIAACVGLALKVWFDERVNARRLREARARFDRDIDARTRDWQRRG